MDGPFLPGRDHLGLRGRTLRRRGPHQRLGLQPPSLPGVQAKVLSTLRKPARLSQKSALALLGVCLGKALPPLQPSFCGRFQNRPRNAAAAAASWLDAWKRTAVSPAPPLNALFPRTCPAKNLRILRKEAAQLALSPFVPEIPKLPLGLILAARRSFVDECGPGRRRLLPLSQSLAKHEEAFGRQSDAADARHALRLLRLAI